MISEPTTLARFLKLSVAIAAAVSWTASAAPNNDVRLALAPSTLPNSPSLASPTVSASRSGQSKAQPLTVAVATDPHTSSSNGQLQSLEHAKALTTSVGSTVRVLTYKSLREIARAAWAGELDAGWLPSNLAVGLLSRGYTLLGTDGRTVQIALLSTSRVQEPKQLVGKTLFLPQEDSLASYVGIAMLSERGVRLTDFSAVRANGTYEVAQLAIASAINDVTALPEEQALLWLKANPNKGRILAVSPELPAQMLVARTTLDAATKTKLTAWASSSLLNGKELATAPPELLKYVGRIAHYTPDDLEGVVRVGAKEAKGLLAKGVTFVDVRTQKEFSAKRIAGAQTVPYTEVSGRVPGGSYGEDPFLLSEIASKEVVFYCNGPECWKSYKAAKRALDSKKFQRVFWLRGGLPEWELEGLPVTQG